MKWLFILGQSLVALAVVWLSATATEKGVVVLCGCFAHVVVAWLTVVWLALACVRRQRLWPDLGGASLSLAVVATVMATAWPLCLTYVMSRPAMRRLADAVQAGNLPNGDVRVGCFVIKHAEVSRHWMVCLWTDLDTRGRTGFMQCRADALPENLWSSIQLDEQWHFVAED